MAVLLFYTTDQSYASPAVKRFVEKSRSQLQIVLILNIIIYILPMMMNFKRACTDILYCLKDYLYYSPAYFHTLLIYAFCNVNDLSW